MGYANPAAGELRQMMARGELPAQEPGPAVADLESSKPEDVKDKVNEILASLRAGGFIEES